MQRPIAGEPAPEGVRKAGRSLSWLYYVVLPDDNLGYFSPDGIQAVNG